MRIVRGAVTVMSGRVTARTGRALAAALVAVFTTALLAGGALAGAGAAAADDEPSRQGGATATLDGLKTYGQAVIHHDSENGADRTTGAGLFEMSVDGGGTLQTYCTDIDHPTQQQARYEETPWKASSLHDNANAGKVRWILQHSYPQVNDLAALAKSSGARRLSPQTAAAGTQVAIWRYSDGAEVNASDPSAEKLADHLQRAARNLAEPEASLSLDPADVSGKTGRRLGPVTVRTTASSAAVSPAAGTAGQVVRVVGRDGRPVTSARNGERLYFDVPEPDKAAPGTSSLTVEAATKIPVGRAFTGAAGHTGSQTQILAGSSQSTVSATATVNWAREGALPAATAEKNCAKGGVDVTVANTGDRPFRYRLADKERDVAAGSTETVTVPVQEDQPYDISVRSVTAAGAGAGAPAAGSGGFGETFSGVLDCATVSALGSQDEPGIAPQAHAGTAAGDEPGTATVDGGGDLAQTGTGTGTGDTPLILGIAIGLVLLGVVAVLAVRRPDGGPQAAPADRPASRG